MKLYADDIISHELNFHYAVIRSIKDTSDLHDHDFYEFFLTFGGDVIHIVNGNKIRLFSNSLVFIRPRDRHGYERIEQGDCQIMNVAFPSRTMESLHAFLGPSKLLQQMMQSELPPSIVISSLEARQMLDKFQQLAWSSFSENERKETAILFKVMLTEVLFRFNTNMVAKEENPVPVWLEHLKAEMSKKEYFTEGLTALHRLSSKSPEHISRSMKKHFGASPTEWINDIRLRHAANLLPTTDFEIIEVALDSGFDNLSHFYHLFKKKFNQTPVQYRKSNKRVVIPN